MKTIQDIGQEIMEFFAVCIYVTVIFIELIAGGLCSRSVYVGTRGC